MNHKTSCWDCIGELFPESAMPELECLPEALANIRPLSFKHARKLTEDIRELSALLTFERSLLSSPYWSKPGLLSAYLYYFLPWNLIRLIRLFRGLPISAPNSANPLLLDAASGPLTVPIALWLAKPEWRALPITVTALDTARQPLLAGLQLWQALGKILETPIWLTHLETGSLTALSKYAQDTPWLITAANVLNELKSPIPQHGAETPGSIEKLLLAWGPLYNAGNCQLLFVEPGTRLGGTTIMSLRATALEYGLTPLAPCTHDNACPLLMPGRGWCHFVFSAQNAPEWLKDISRKARLFKTSLSLSPLFLRPAQRPKAAPQGLPARVISQPFEAQGAICRYGCTSKGLGLMKNARNLFSGTLTSAQALPHGRDKKSGAHYLEPFPTACRAPKAAGNKAQKQSQGVHQ